MTAPSLRHLLTLTTVATLTFTSVAAEAQPEEPTPTPTPVPAPALPPPPDVPPAEPQPATPIPEPMTPAPEPPTPREPVLVPAPAEDRPPSGRELVSMYNTGFQWGISPGIAVVRDKVGFAIGLRAGYGIDLGPMIFVPGARVAAYFVDGTVFVPMPTVKLVFPIGAFAPFIEGGAGLGIVSKPSGTGISVLGGGGFMYHFSDRFALGAHATYETIVGKLSGTKPDFRGIGVGPIIAIGF